MAIGILSFDQKVPTFLKKLGRFQQKTGRFRQRIAEFLFANAEGGGAQVLTPVINIVYVGDFPFAFIIGRFDSAVYLVLVDVDAQAVEAQGEGASMMVLRRVLPLPAYQPSPSGVTSVMVIG